MAVEKRVSYWRLLRLLLVAAWLSIWIRVTIPDYPWGMNLWDAWILDRSGYWHEIAYISALFWAWIFCTFAAQILERKTERVYIVRRKGA